MRVFIDVFSGDEFFSDSYPHEECYEGHVLKVKAKYTTKKNEQIAIASDDVADDDEGGETVIDIVDAFQLQEMTFGKKDLMAYFKAYMKRSVEHLTKKDKGDIIDSFKKQATAFVKDVIAKFDEVQFWCGSKFDTEGSMGFSWTMDGEVDPTFFFLCDLLKQEKY
jgi:hypothetical protein